MIIDPTHISEFKEWMREKLKASPARADMAEVRALIEMMRVGQWPMIADISDRKESDVIGNVEFEQADLMELDEYERPYYEEFLRERTKR